MKLRVQSPQTYLNLSIVSGNATDTFAAVDKSKKSHL